MNNVAILVVEDDGIHALLLRSMLERRGFTVLGPVASGEEALAILARQSVGLVLLDMQLAGRLDGFETGCAIGRDHQIPVVFVTGLSQEIAGLDRAGEAEPYGYLIKPVSEESLLTTIQVALSRHRIDRELRQRQQQVVAREAEIKKKFEALLSPQGDLGDLSLADVINVPVLGEMLADFQRLIGSEVAILGGDGQILLAFGRKIPALATNPALHIPLELGGQRIGAIAIGAVPEGAEGAEGEGEDNSPPPTPRNATITAFARSLAILLSTLWSNAAQLSRALAEKNQVLRQLHEHQTLQLSLLENIPLPVFAKDRAGRYLICNGSYKEFFGKSDEEILGLDTFAVHPPDLAELYLDRDEELLRLGTTQRYETKIRHHDGELRDGIVHKTLWRDGEGRVIGLVGTILDITERNRAEEEKKRLQAQLLQAQKMEAIGTLAGGIAHDFNNILGAILGYAEMVRDDSPPGSTAARDLDQILLAGSRAKDLVKQILAFSRQSEAERIPLQPAAIIKETIKLLRASLPTTISIATKIDATTLPILADPVQLHQLVMNLCTNAFHAMEERGGVLTIALANVSAPEELAAKGAYGVQLTVADTGVGIAPEIREKIFNPYFTTKGLGKGTGMGLSIVHGIVSDYGGTIDCQSHPGEGTTFTIVLPALSATTDILESLPSREEPLPGGERILFVDDEEALVRLTRTMLERLGYRVTVCHDSREALAVFARDPQAFDLVITDQTMPGMTGLDLARQLLALRLDLPIILCSGYSGAVNEEVAKSAGIKGFAAKPLVKKEIGDLIRQVLSQEP